jgi:hypothetical protein
MKSNHLEGEGLHPIVDWIPECYGLVDLPMRYCLLPLHDAMEWHSGRPNARPVDAHGIQVLGVHDVEATAPVHQYLGEALHAEDWVDHERAPPWLRNAAQLVGSVEMMANSDHRRNAGVSSSAV